MKKSKLLKRFVIIFMSMMSVNFAFADSCLMVAPSNITKVECKNNNVLTLNILTTLAKEKKSVVVSSKQDGETTFFIYMKNKKCDYKATVSNGKLKIKGDSAIKILPVDLPPELEITDEVVK